MMTVKSRRCQFDFVLPFTTRLLPFRKIAGTPAHSFTRSGTMIINCHTHTFTDTAVPDRFLPFGLVRFLARGKVTAHIARFLHNLIPFYDRDLFDHFALFLKIGVLGSQENVFQTLASRYPVGTKFVVITMDMTYMECGVPAQPFNEQCDELAALSDKFAGRIIPILAADPRRPDLSDFVKHYIEDKHFAGIKIYPPLGYFPYDERLIPVMAYAEKNRIPVISHVAREGVYYRGKLNRQSFAASRIGSPNINLMNHFQKCSFFTHPEHYRILMKQFPNLRLVLAHCGGYFEWFRHLHTKHRTDESLFQRDWLSICLELMREFPSLHADISGAIEPLRGVDALKGYLTDPVLSKKILFGTDFYMDELFGGEKPYSSDLEQKLGEDLFNKIAYENPCGFYKIAK
jgi:predicted TIM-barrel fold metal-dependent hydrolase